MAAVPADRTVGTPSGGVIAAGRFAARPILGAIGTSLIQENANVMSGSWTGQSGYGHYKWMNTILRKPFDYVLLPGMMKNGIYGLSGGTADDIEAVCDEYVAAMQPLVGNRRCLIGIDAAENSLYAGTAAATVYGLYDSMIAQFAANGWRSLVSEIRPSNAFSTIAKTDNAAAFSALVQADADVTNLSGMLNSFHDPAKLATDGLLNPLPGYTSDGTHLSISGAVKLGLISADVLAGQYQPWQPRASDVVCSTNPTLSGTGGVKTGASGVAPDGWTLTASGITTIGTQTAEGFEFECTYSGAPYSGGGYCALTPTVAQMSNVVIGETRHEALGDIEILECENFGFQMGNAMGGGTGLIPGGLALASYTAASTLRWSEWLVGRRMVLHSDPFLAPAGMTRSDATLLVKPFLESTTARLKLRIRWLGVKQT